MAGWIIEGILDVIDAGSITWISNSRNKLPVYFAGGYFVALFIKDAYYNAIGGGAIGTKVNQILGAFSEYIAVFNFVFGNAIHFIAFQKIKTICQLGNTGVCETFRIARLIGYGAHA